MEISRVKMWEGNKHFLLTRYISSPDRQLSSLTVCYTMLKSTLVVKLWRDSEITQVTGLEHMDRSCKDNHRTMTGVGLVFIFTANPLSPDLLPTLGCLYKTTILKACDV